VDANGDVTQTKFLPKALVGYVSATFYLVNSAASFAGGKLAPRIGKRPLLVGTLLTHALYFGAVLALTQVRGVPRLRGVCGAGRRRCR